MNKEILNYLKDVLGIKRIKLERDPTFETLYDQEKNKLFQADKDVCFVVKIPPEIKEKANTMISKMLEAMGIAEDSSLILDHPEEVFSFFERNRIHNVVVFGEELAQSLGIQQKPHDWGEWNLVPTIVTEDLAQSIDQVERKKIIWSDLKKVREKLK